MNEDVKQALEVTLRRHKKESSCNIEVDPYTIEISYKRKKTHGYVLAFNAKIQQVVETKDNRTYKTTIGEFQSQQQFVKYLENKEILDRFAISFQRYLLDTA